MLTAPHEPDHSESPDWLELTDRARRCGLPRHQRRAGRAERPRSASSSTAETPPAAAWAWAADEDDDDDDDDDDFEAEPS